MPPPVPNRAAARAGRYATTDSAPCMPQYHRERRVEASEGKAWSDPINLGDIAHFDTYRGACGEGAVPYTAPLPGRNIMAEVSAGEILPVARGEGRMRCYRKDYPVDADSVARCCRGAREPKDCDPRFCPNNGKGCFRELLLHANRVLAPDVDTPGGVEKEDWFAVLGSYLDSPDTPEKDK